MDGNNGEESVEESVGGTRNCQKILCVLKKIGGGNFGSGRRRRKAILKMAMMTMMLS